MKSRILNVMALALAFVASADQLAAQGSAFTYQGLLSDQGTPANGLYDLQFSLFPLAAGGSPLGGPLSANDVAVTNGLFTMTLDFGVGPFFNGAARWLEIGVRPGASSGPFTNVAPRQAVLPTPYAIYSSTMNATGLIGTISTANLGDGTITSNKLAANSVTSTHLATGTVTTADLAVDAVTASRLAESFQSGFLSFPGSSPGTNVTISFPRPFESTPSVTLNSPHLFATNITISNFQVNLPPYGIVVDNSPNVVGRYLSMALVNGNPAIAYYDETSGDLKYCRALSTNGGTWGAPVVAHVGGASLVGKFPSLAVVNGRPAVAYQDDTADDLKYVRANDVNGATWAPALTVASVGNVGQYAQLKIVNGRPAIAYFDATTNSLQFVRAADADGASWGSPVTVDQGASTNTVGEYPSLEIVNGLPAIAYRARTADVLRYARATDADGTGWSAPVEISNLPRAGEEISLAMVDGRPAVAYLARGAEVHFERAGDANGTNWVFSSAVVGGVRDISPSGLALRVVAGLPRIAFWHGQGGEVHYTEGSFASGGNWKPPARIIFGSGTAGGTAALLDLYGTPVVAGMGTAQDVRFSTAVAIPFSYTAREAVQIEATSVAAGSITREMLAPGVFGTASADGAIAFGSSQALNQNAFAIGSSTASGLTSFAGGLGSTASGQGSMAFGWNAQATAAAAIALGDNTIADQGAQVAVGRYNRPNAFAVFIVGNGSFSGRNTALWVENDGDLEITGAAARKPGGGSWVIPSDARLKNIEAPFDRGLEALHGINPVAYRYKAGNAKHLPTGTRFIGPVAQEVEQHIPEAVTTDEQGYRLVNNDPIIWTMFNAIKELEARTRSHDTAASGGAAQAAIQALNRKLEEQNRSLRNELKAKTADLQALKQRVADLEKLTARGN